MKHSFGVHLTRRGRPEWRCKASCSSVGGEYRCGIQSGPLRVWLPTNGRHESPSRFTKDFGDGKNSFDEAGQKFRQCAGNDGISEHLASESNSQRGKRHMSDNYDVMSDSKDSTRSHVLRRRHVSSELRSTVIHISQQLLAIQGSRLRVGPDFTLSQTRSLYTPSWLQARSPAVGAIIAAEARSLSVKNSKSRGPQFRRHFTSTSTRVAEQPFSEAAPISNISWLDTGSMDIEKPKSSGRKSKNRMSKGSLISESPPVGDEPQIEALLVKDFIQAIKDSIPAEEIRPAPTKISKSKKRPRNSLLKNKSTQVGDEPLLEVSPVQGPNLVIEGSMLSKEIRPIPTKTSKSKKRVRKGPLKNESVQVGEDPCSKALLAESRNQFIKENSKLPIEVYEYAALFNVTPVIKTEVGQTEETKFKVHIAIPSLKLQSEAQDSQFNIALILASIDFMKQAALIVPPRTVGVKYERARQLLTRTFGEKINIAVVDWPVANAFQAQVMLEDKPLGELVAMPSKRHAVQLACLAAAVVNKIPGRIAKLAGIAQSKSDKQSVREPDIFPHPAAVGSYALVMKILRDLGAQEGPVENWTSAVGGLAEDSDLHIDPPNIVGNKARDQLLKFHQLMLERQMQTVPKYIDIKRMRDSLTINQHREEVLDMVANNDVCILSSGTGSGKSTQLPQILLDAAISQGVGTDCNIICTQPRKIAATSVARRVANERNDQDLRSVGYHVRFDRDTPIPGGSICYCTTGILLQKLENAPNNTLNNVSHIIVDEVHERDIAIDTLMAILKHEIHKRRCAGLPFPKIILSSATVDAELVSKYFQDDAGKPCPSLSIPGRLFNVERMYLDEIDKVLNTYPPKQIASMSGDKEISRYLTAEKKFGNQNSQVSDVETDDNDERLAPCNLICFTIAHIAKTTSSEGAILVFLPGIESIVKVERMLSANSPLLDVDFNDRRKFKIIALHSSLQDGQAAVFVPVPQGCRKIILSTNIAETSVTVTDVAHVVDTGKHKRKMYDPASGVTHFRSTWISKSNATQRAGRAGRVQNGCYYALFSQRRAEQLRATESAEIRRSDLQNVCSQVAHLAHSYKMPIRDFLNTWIEPPATEAVQNAITALQSIGALTEDEEVTSLGQVLGSLPVHPAMGKMILMSIIFRCVDPIVILVASFEGKDLFHNPPYAKEEARAARLSFDPTSDHFGRIKAFDQGRLYGERNGVARARQWFEEKYVSFLAFRGTDRVAEQMEMLLGKFRLMPREWNPNYTFFGSEEVNQNSGEESLIRAVMVAGFHPNIAASWGSQTLRNIQQKPAIIGESSANGSKYGRPRGSLFTFSTLAEMSGGGFICQGTTTISPLMAILFGRKLRLVNRTMLEVDGWLRFQQSSPQYAAQLVNLKTAIDHLLATIYLEVQNKHVEGLRYLHVHPKLQNFTESLTQLLNLDMQNYNAYLAAQPIVSKKNDDVAAGIKRLSFPGHPYSEHPSGHVS